MERNNALIERGEFTRPDPRTQDRLADISDERSQNVVSEDSRYIRNSDGRLVRRIREITARRGPCEQARRETFATVESKCPQQ